VTKYGDPGSLLAITIRFAAGSCMPSATAASHAPEYHAHEMPFADSVSPMVLEGLWRQMVLRRVDCARIAAFGRRHAARLPRRLIGGERVSVRRELARGVDRRPDERGGWRVRRAQQIAAAIELRPQVVWAFGSYGVHAQMSQK
jgi:hypothetical protein